MNNFNHSLGWMPDLPDFRDFTAETTEISEILRGTKLNAVAAKKSTSKKKSAAPLRIPATVDLRAWCSPIEDQGQLGSCTAQAGVGLLEYFQRRGFGVHLEASRLFLYKVTRNLLKWTGDTGAYLRTTMKAMAGFGVCLETYWPYSDAKTGDNGVPTDPFEKEPSSFCYALAANYKSLKYFRLDPAGASGTTVLNNIKNNLAAGIPCMFGFTVYNTISQAGSTGKIPYPVPGSSVIGGHAVVAIGYDNNIVIGTGANATTGALLIRNSWGTGWGNNGYGYLPYKYVTQLQARDFWTLVDASFFNTNNF